MLLAYKYKAIVSYAMGAIIGVRKKVLFIQLTQTIYKILYLSM